MCKLSVAFRASAHAHQCIYTWAHEHTLMHRRPQMRNMYNAGHTRHTAHGCAARLSKSSHRHAARLAARRGVVRGRCVRPLLPHPRPHDVGARIGLGLPQERPGTRRWLHCRWRVDGRRLPVKHATGPNVSQTSTHTRAPPRQDYRIVSHLSGDTHCQPNIHCLCGQSASLSHDTRELYPPLPRHMAQQGTR